MVKDAPFTARITRNPLSYDVARGAEIVAALPGMDGVLRDLLHGAAGCSPYLARSMEREASWLEEALTQAPETAIEALLDEARAASGPETGRILRHAKRRAALLIALADLGGVWPLARVTRALTEFAEAAGAAALTQAAQSELAQGKLPGFTERDAAHGAGLFVLAMGKMGAYELNYSSDIDLICFFDGARFDGDILFDARKSYIRIVRKFTALMGQVTEEGYVFRTDLRLRPDAGVTPVALSVQAAEQYYEAEGRTWERGAFIKARAALGDVTAGVAFLDRMSPFVWRRHLDFATLHDVQDIRQRIRNHKRLSDAPDLAGRDVKLAPGGIRDVEFFAQTRQLIFGGRDPDLRMSGTVAALSALAEKGWIPQGEAEALANHYARLREIEHRLQMIGDVQTHKLPTSRDDFDRLARFCGYGDTGTFQHDLAALFSAVDALAKPFFAPERPQATQPVALSEGSQALVDQWPRYPALRSDRGQEIFARLKPSLLAQFAKASRPDEALANFDGFLRGLPAGVQLFSLFEANPTLVDLIVDICATAPGLSRYLARHPGVLDAVLMGNFFAPWPGLEALKRALEKTLDGASYEAALDLARRWQKDWHFGIGVHLLRDLVTPKQAAAHYSGLAEAVVAALWPVAQAQVAERHGPPPGRGGVVLAMGSLGAAQLNAASDLDLIVIYDAAGDETSDGARPLAARAWYAKATKALITALSAPTGEGVIYSVDMRLRPSGGSGPVATSLAAFESYQRDQAWTWEHLALTRARVVAGPADLARDVEAVRVAEVARQRDTAKIYADTSEMRARLREAGRLGSTFDVKAGPGGMQDIELLAEATALLSGCANRHASDQLDQAHRAGLLPNAPRLAEIHALFAAVLQVARLLTDRALDPDDIGSGGRAVLIRAGEASEIEALAAKLDASRAEAAAMIDAMMPETGAVDGP